MAYGQTAVRVLDAAAQPQPWTGSIANSRAEGSAVISKTVTGAGDTAELFDFTVTLTHGDGTPFTEAVMWQLQNAAGSTLASGKLLPGEAGQLSLQLRHGEQITLSRIPQGVQLTVSEQERAGYTVSVNGQQGSSFAGVISKDGVLTAAFENYKPRTNVNTGV
ncbi:MAG: hypothetical protein IJC61_05305 [Oscillospiraceae bacterium]|nr:hypothetical protein [Oscillospiraceae bacterium]